MSGVSIANMIISWENNMNISGFCAVQQVFWQLYSTVLCELSPDAYSDELTKKERDASNVAWKLTSYNGEWLVHTHKQRTVSNIKFNFKL